jgi:hypothetical protein
VLEKLARFAEEGFADRSEADGMCLSFQQTLADLDFQRFDLTALADLM